MLEYLQKFKALPQELRNAVSGAGAVAKINELEARFGVSLADIVIRLMVKDIALSALPAVLVMEQKLDLLKADELFTELKSGVLAPVLSYLGNNLPVTQIDNNGQQINTIKSTQEVAKSPFYFDPEDEAEVRGYAEKSGVSEADLRYQQQAKDIIVGAELSFGSETLLERLQSIIVTHLSGVRNRIDTNLALSKSIDQGGVNLDDQAKEKIFKAIDGVKSQETRVKSQGGEGNLEGLKSFVAGSKEDFEKMKEMGARDFEYDIQSLVDKSKVESQAQDTTSPRPSPSVREGTKYESRPSKGEGVIAETPKTLGRPKQEKESFNVADSDPFAYRRPKEAVGKVVMSDVKINLPKVMGPIDELHYLDLVVFRRLAKTPDEAILKIKDKVDLLEAEMFSKKLEGIKAWRLSPLYLEYLKIAETAINTGQAVSEVIENQAKQRISSLSLPEFEAIMKLNKELRF